MIESNFALGSLLASRLQDATSSRRIECCISCLIDGKLTLCVSTWSSSDMLQHSLPYIDGIYSICSMNPQFTRLDQNSSVINSSGVTFAFSCVTLRSRCEVSPCSEYRSWGGKASINKVGLTSAFGVCNTRCVG